MRVHHRELAVPLERRLADQALVQDAAEGVHVRASVDGQPLDLLGGGVVDGSEDEAGLREALRPVVLDDAEVGQVGAIGRLGDQDVRGLDIAVDEAALVRGVEASARLLRQEGSVSRLPGIPRDGSES